MGSTERIAVLARGVAVGLPWLWALTYLLPPLNGDAAAILLFAVRMLHGDRLYVDLIDVNPPLIFWLSLPPAWLAGQLGIGPAPLLVAFALAGLAAALALCRAPLARLRMLAPAAWQAALAPAVLVALLVLPRGEFAQRETLMTGFALPYLALAALRLAGGGLPAAGAAGRAAFAATGFLIKPYFLLVPLAVELALLVRLGARGALKRPEPWVIAGLGLAYAAAALAVHPAYFTDVLPLADRYYRTADPAAALAAVLGPPERRWLVAAAAAALVPALLQRRDPLRLVAGLFGLAMALSALLQGKGWPYHVLPLWQAALVAGALGLAGLVRDATRPGLLGRAGLQAATAGGLVAVTIALACSDPPWRDRLGYRDSFAGRLEPLLAPAARGGAVLWLTDAIYPKYPVILYDEARPAARWMELWLLDALYRAPDASRRRPPMRAPAQMSADERRLFDMVGQSLARSRPALVLVASAAAERGAGAERFDYLGYFLRHPSFAREWRHYAPAGEIDGTRIYRRRDPAS